MASIVATKKRLAVETPQMDTLFRRELDLTKSSYNFETKKKMWIEALANKQNKNTFTTIHGDPQDVDNLSFKIPENIIVVFITPPSNVIFSNGTDDMESLIYLKNPNWFKSDYSDKPDTCNNANIPKSGFSRPDPKHWLPHEYMKDEPKSLKGFKERVGWRKKEELKKGTPTGSKNILNYASVYFPGDSCYNQDLAYEKDDEDYEAWYLGKPYTTAEVGGKDGGYRKLYHKEILKYLEPYFKIPEEKKLPKPEQKLLTPKKYDLLFQFFDIGITHARPPIAMESSDTLYPRIDMDRRQDIPKIWNFAQISEEINKKIYFELEKKAEGSDYQPRINTTEKYLNFLSEESIKKN